MNKEQIYYLYLVTRLDGEKYIGVTSDISRRMAQHRNGYGNKYLKSVEFTVEILQKGSETEIYNLEEEYILKYKCSLNIAKGGIGGNGQRGIDNFNSLLTEIEVLEIKNILINLTDISYKEIAEFYKVAETTISNIANNKTWKHVGTVVPKRGHKQIDDIIVSKILELYLAGATEGCISKQLKISKSTVFRYVKDISNDSRSKVSGTRRKLTDTDIISLRRLRSEGKSIAEVARLLGIGTTSVSKYQ